MIPRVRIAPSPTGYLHVGTARAALYNWLFARNTGGQFILRIEDTDVNRSSSEMSEAIIESLKWLGLTWDEGPIFQSRRTELYKKYVDVAREKGVCYQCWCTSEEIEARKAEVMAQKKAWKYDRHCLNLAQARLPQSAAERAKHLWYPEKNGGYPDLSGQSVNEISIPEKPCAFRFLIPDGKVSFYDRLHGQLERDSVDIEDFVMWKSDGTPSYNFACVIDDHEMGITHVIRGEDHISNTFKQVLIYKALGWKPPEFVHLPMILGPDRSKLSKRHGAVSVLEYQKHGILPSALVNYLALLGWSPGGDREVMSVQEIIKLFSLEKLGVTASIFDKTKLEWVNGEHMNKLSDDKLLDEILHFVGTQRAVSSPDVGQGLKSLAQEDRPYLLKIINLLKPRMRLLSEFVPQADFFFKDPVEYDPAGVEKYFKTGLHYIPLLIDKFSALPALDLQNVENAIRILAEEQAIKPALLIHTLRLALTGKTVGPSLFHLMEVLGKERVIRRLEKIRSIY